MSQAAPPPVDESPEALVFERLPFGVAVLDGDLRILRLNRALAALAGLAVVDAVGRTLPELFPRAAQAIESTLRAFMQIQLPLVDATLDLEPGPVQMNAFPLPTGLAVTLRAAPRPPEAAAGDGSAVFHAIFEHAAVGMVAFKWRGPEVRANPAMLAMLGYSAEELAKIGVAGITHPDDFEQDREAFQRLLNGEVDHYQIEKRYVRKDRTVFWGRLVVSLARDAAGAPVLVIAMIEDVTEKRRSDADRELTIRALTEAVRAREVFLSIASHELKTPLTSLKINLQILHKSLPDGSPDQTRTVSAIRQVDRLASLVEKLLDVSRIATGRLTLTREPLDLRELARELVARTQAEAAQAGSVLTLEAPHSIFVSVDRVRIEQVLVNLLSNAIKFGAGHPIDVEVGRAGDLAQLVVRDRGIGIALEEQQRIFGRFERAAPELSYGGLGLGLYISREIVEAHGGTMRVESEPGKGASFFVELPRVE